MHFDPAASPSKREGEKRKANLPTYITYEQEKEGKRENERGTKQKRKEKKNSMLVPQQPLAVKHE